MLISKFGHADISEIEKLQEKYNIIFPQDYRCFLLNYNGGDTPNTKFRIKGVSSDIRAFFGIGSADKNAENNDLDIWIESEVYPIACDSFGNTIVIGINEKNNGSVFFCDHEKGGEMTLIANSFAGFVSKCKSEKISEASKRSIEEREQRLILKGRGNIITDGLRAAWQAEIDKYGNMVQEEVILK